MSRYEGRTSPRTIELNFAHIVEIAVTPNGLGTRFDAMYDWRRDHGIEVQAWSRSTRRKSRLHSVVFRQIRNWQPASPLPFGGSIVTYQPA